MLALAARVSRDPVSLHLASEFLSLPIDTIDRCVGNVLSCTEHIGIEATPDMIERMAREHLLALVNSAPPSSIAR